MSGAGLSVDFIVSTTLAAGFAGTFSAATSQMQTLKKYMKDIKERSDAIEIAQSG